ncbi:hypothetical protein H4R35_005758 [Dimargaris xerosporica]|nr:hypothetical protein H4R35_005758 [Dimargaris xerosporica]
MQQALHDYAQQQPVFDHLWEQQSRPAKLRAADHPIAIPDTLAESWQRWLQQEHITPYRASKLSLVDVVKMWRLAICATFHALGLSCARSFDRQLTSSSSPPASPQTAEPSNVTTGYPSIQYSTTGDRVSLFDAIPQLPHPPQLADFFVNAADTRSFSGEDWDTYLAQEQQRLQQIRAFKTQLEQRRLHLLAKLTSRAQASSLPCTTTESAQMDSTIHCPSFFSNHA